MKRARAVKWPATPGDQTMRTALLALFVIPAFVLADDTEPKDTKTKAREISVKGLTGLRGRFKEPTKITTKEDLEKHVESKEAREEILKAIDFKKEYLVLFRWS